MHVTAAPAWRPAKGVETAQPNAPFEEPSDEPPVPVARAPAAAGGRVVAVPPVPTPDAPPVVPEEPPVALVTPPVALEDPPVALGPPPVGAVPPVPGGSSAVTHARTGSQDPAQPPGQVPSTVSTR